MVENLSPQTPRKNRVAEKGSPLERDRRDRKSNAVTGASAAGVRALGSQAIALYLRAPAKAFFRTRVDYLAFARAINPHFQAQESWSYRISTPGLLAHAVKSHGWSFIPNYVLPPLIANIGIGAILYTSYLQTLGALYPPSSHSLKRVYPPPSFHSTFTAGFIAGTIQSVVAAPLDALSIRSKPSEILHGKHKTMWAYGWHKIRDIGTRGIFAGWTLAFLKDAFGYGAFFATFEYVKAQAYYEFVVATSQYRQRSKDPDAPENPHATPVIRPHWATEPIFLMLAGVAASLAQQAFAYPLSRISNVHVHTIEHIDRLVSQSRKDTTHPPSSSSSSTSQKPKTKPSPPSLPFRAYADAYRRTYASCAERAKRSGGWRRWLYKAFWINTVKQVPSTSAGLIIFELVRRRYRVAVVGDDDDGDDDGGTGPTGKRKGMVVERDGVRILLN